jgi:hypothetical protein
VCVCSRQRFGYGGVTARQPHLQAYRKFDILTSKHIETLRKYTKQIQDARLASNNDAIKFSLKLYDGALERFVFARWVPVGPPKCG